MRVFLLASFPSLQFDGNCPLSFEDLLRECAAHLPPDEFAELDAVTSQPPGGSTRFAHDWQLAWAAWQTANETERSKRLPGTPAPTPSFNAFPSDQLRHDLENAWQAADPLLREKGLLRALWNWVEQRRRQAPFSLDDLNGYALQLQMLERSGIWQDAQGLTQFQEHTQSFLEPVLEALRNQELSV